jgi:hypothetical protein
MPFTLLLITGCTPGDVMNRTYRYSAHAVVRRADDINDGARLTGSCRIPKAIALPLNQPKPRVSVSSEAVCSYPSSDSVAL